MNNGIEKLQKYAFGMKPRRCDDILVLAGQIEREHVAELQALEERYNTDLRSELHTIEERYKTDLREARDFRRNIAIMLGISCDGMADDVYDAIKAELDKRLMPLGMEWPPKDSEGEDLSIGDKAHFLRTEYDGDHEWHDVVTAFRHQGIEGEGDVWIVEGDHGEAFACECTKLTEPEVLGADGLPIEIGDTVYLESFGRPFTVVRFDGAYLKDANGGLMRADCATHTPPDTQERINEDTWKDATAYCQEYGVPVEYPKHAGKMKCEHLLSRQRELDARTMGGAE